MEFRILGPLDVGLDGHSLPLGGPKQRAVLALLLLSANRVVSRDRLIQELWPDHKVPAADHALRLQISRLRKTLSAADIGEPRLVTRAPGYLLRVEPQELDLHRFERLVADAQGALDRGEAEHAATLLREADSLWRGRPLADLEFEPFARVDVERLEELRLGAVELRIDAELARGRHATLVPELEALVAEHPLRERLRAQLMRALYANARQAEALAVYTDTRRLLVDELGIEPSEELRAMERRVLNQDPALLPRANRAPLAEPADVDESPDERRHRVRWAVRRRLPLLAGPALAAALVGGVFLAGQGQRATRSAAVQPDSVTFLDERSGKLVGQTAVGPAAGQIAIGAGSVWKLEGAGALLQIDSRSLRLIRSIPLGMNHGDIALGAGAVWVSGDAPVLARVDPKYGAVERILLPRGGLSRPGAGGGIAVGAGSVWVAQGLSRVIRLDPATGRVERRFRVADANVLAFGGGALWVASSDLGTLTRIDPRTDTVAATVRVGPWICCLAVGGGYAWAANDTGVWKVSATGEPVATTKLPNEAGDIAYGGGALWVTAEDSVIRIDAATNAVRRYRLGHPLNGVGADGRRVAVSVFASPADLTRHLGRDVLRGAFGAIWFDATDPAIAAAPGQKNWATEQQLQYATCARLLNHPDASAPAGQRLVAEIAAASPTVSPDGRTYTFRIRPGFRFSPPSNARVTAGTFKYSIERALSPRLGPGAPAASLASDIVGVGAYRAGRAGHIAGVTASGDILSIALVRPAPDLPERIAASYFCPVPIGTPIVANGLEDPIPSAGPYYLSANQGGAVAVLKRNPNYRGPRPHRLDAIVFREQIPLGSTVARINASKTDYAAENGAALAPDIPLARRFGQTGAGQSRRYFRTPLLGTDELVVATRRAPLASARVRRAVNFALDRPALAAALGDLVTDRYLPPGMPGFADGHVYPLGGPDLRRARALMNGRRLRARLALCGEPSCLELGRAVRADLDRIGIRVELRRYSGEIASRLRSAGADLVLARAVAPYPDPVAFLRSALGDAIPSGRLDAIARLERRRRLPAAGRLELSLLRRQAPAAAFGTPTIPEFFSTRVGCKTFPPVSFGVDLAALCLPRR